MKIVPGSASAYTLAAILGASPKISPDESHHHGAGLDADPRHPLRTARVRVRAIDLGQRALNAEHNAMMPSPRSLPDAEAASRWPRTRSRQSSPSIGAEMQVNPTMSQNLTVSWRRSAAFGPIGSDDRDYGEGSGANRRAATTAGAASLAIADNNFRRFRR